MKKFVFHIGDTLSIKKLMVYVRSPIKGKFKVKLCKGDAYADNRKSKRMVESQTFTKITDSSDLVGIFKGEEHEFCFLGETLVTRIK